MPFLSPAKLLIILVVALIVLGPDKLPHMAKQAGGLWNDFRKFRKRLETEVRGTFPDLPSTDKITQAVRSPMAFLDGLADNHESETGSTAGLVTTSRTTGEPGDLTRPSGRTNRPAAGTVVVTEESPVIPGVSISEPGGVVHTVRSSGVAELGDPGMN